MLEAGCRLPASIEEQDELSLLKDEDCDNGQGFLFARPLDVTAIESFFPRHGDVVALALAPATPTRNAT